MSLIHHGRALISLLLVTAVFFSAMTQVMGMWLPSSPDMATTGHMASMDMTQADSAGVAMPSMKREGSSCKHQDCCQGAFDMHDCTGHCIPAMALIQTDSTGAVLTVAVYDLWLVARRADNISVPEPRPPRSRLS